VGDTPRVQCSQLLQIDDGELDEYVIAAAIALSNMQAPRVIGEAIVVSGGE